MSQDALTCSFSMMHHNLAKQVVQTGRRFNKAICMACWRAKWTLTLKKTQLTCFTSFFAIEKTQTGWERRQAGRKKQQQADNRTSPPPVWAQRGRPSEEVTSCPAKENRKWAPAPCSCSTSPRSLWQEGPVLAAARRYHSLAPFTFSLSHYSQADCLTSLLRTLLWWPANSPHISAAYVISRKTASDFTGMCWKPWKRHSGTVFRFLWAQIVMHHARCHFMMCITVTACAAPPFLFLAFVLHLISILLLLTTKKTHVSPHSCQFSHISWVCTLSSPSSPSLSLSAHFEPWPTKTWISQASQTYAFHMLITRFIFLFPPLVLNMTSPPCSLRPNVEQHQPARQRLCAQIHIPSLFLSSPFSYVINSNYRGPPTRHSLIL